MTGGIIVFGQTLTKRILVTFLVLFLFVGLASNVDAQQATLEEMELVNMGDGYRIFIQCSGSPKFTSKLAAGDLQLEIFFYETHLDIKKNNLKYKNTPVSKITASRWQASPPVVKVTISFVRPLNYEVRQRMAGLFYVDLTEKDQPTVPRGGDDGDFRIAFPAETANGTDRSDTVLSRPRSNPVSGAFLHSTTVPSAELERLPDPLNSNELISLEAKSARITDVLRLLAKQTRLNIVAIEDTGRVTVNLVNVSIKEALDLIARANGYDYIVKGDVILVKPLERFQLNELQTRVYRLKYIDANNLEATISQVLSEQAKVQVFYSNFSATAGSKTAASEGGGSGDRGRSSTLVVTDVPLNLKQLDAMIAVLDVRAPQIMIEAKLIEISPRDEQRLGIDWSKTVNAEIFREIILPGGAPYRQAVEVPLDGGSLNFGTLNIGQYNAALEFLNTNTNAKLVSNPRILAMDNQTAFISVGQNIPIPQISRGVGGQGDIVSFEYRNFNISLEVTPHVAEDDILTLRVNPILEEIIGEVVVGESRAPITSRREVETVVNLRSGETIVIGGLIKESTIETTTKVWMLGDIPLIGNLFRHKVKSKKQTDLIIFITPTLVSPGR